MHNRHRTAGLADYARAVSRSGANRLVIVPTITVPDRRSPRLPKKFMSGVDAFAQRWPGQVVAILGENRVAGDLLDVVPVGHGLVDYRFVSDVQKELARELEESPGAVVYGMLVERFEWLERACALGGASLVLGSDNPPASALEWDLINTSGQLPRARTRLGNLRRKRSLTRFAAKAVGVQCNGRPTFDFYSRVNPNSMLFLDSRITASDIEESMEQRTRRPIGDTICTLAFSGRIALVKGSRLLPNLVEELRGMRTPFRLLVIGDGVDRAWLEQALLAPGDRDDVRFMGDLPFHESWTTTMRDLVDLIVMPNILEQDSSSTYMEAMGCGVAIAGFDNAMLRGLKHDGLVAWTSKRGNIAELASIVDALCRDPLALRQGRDSGLAVMQDNSMEVTFDRRVEHLLNASAGGK